MKKRILSMLLVVCMLMSMLPTAVFADDASVSDLQTLQDAIANASDGETITLTDNIAVDMSTTAENSGAIIVDKSITIDGAGYTLSASGGVSNATLLLITGGNPTITNLTVDGSSGAKHGIQVYNASAALNNVASQNNAGYGVLVNHSDVTATDLTTSGNSWGGVNVDANGESFGTGSAASFTMNGGSIAEDASVVIEGSAGDTTTTTINGGTLQNVVKHPDTAASAGEDTITIGGGTITGDVLGDIVTVNAGDIGGSVTGKTSAEIIGGTIGGTISPVYQVNYTKGTDVEVAGLEGSYAKGQKVTFTATANTGFELGAGSVRVVTASGTTLPVTRYNSGECVFTMPAEDVNVTVTATALPGSKTVTFMNGGNVAGTKTVTEGTAIGVADAPVLTPDAGYDFVEWNTSADGSGDTLVDGTVINQDTTFYAIFNAKEYDVVDRTAADLTVAGLPTIANVGTKISFTLKPAEGSSVSNCYVQPDNGTAITPTITNVADDGTVSYEFTMPADNVTIQAESAKDVYVVVFKADDAIVDYRTVDHGGVVDPLPAVPAKEGYENGTWQYNGAEFTTTTTVTENITVTASYDAVAYQIETVSDPDVTITAAAATAKAGEKVTFTVKPEEGKTVSGAIVTPENTDLAAIAPVEKDTAADGTVTYEFTMPASDVTITATTAAKTYEVKYQYEDGTYIDSETVEHGNAITKTVPAKDGYEDGKWYNGGAEYDVNAPVTADLVLTAKYTVKEYKVGTPVVYVNGEPAQADTVSAELVNPTPEAKAEYGQKVQFNVTAKEGYYFEDTAVTTAGGDAVTVDLAGITKNADGNYVYSYEFTMPAEDVEIAVYFTTKENYYYLVKFVDEKDPTQIYDIQLVYVGKTASKPANAPAKDGARFEGWYTDADGNTEFDFNTAITAETVVYAHFTADTYTLTFKGADNVADMKGGYDEWVILPEPAGDNSKTFSYWLGDDDGVHYLANSKYQIKGNASFRAVWDAEQVTIQFVADGAITATETVDYGSDLYAPAAPAKTGYTFQYWEKGNEQVRENNKVDTTADGTYTAVYTPNNYTINYVTNGGKPDAGVQNASYGDVIHLPAAPAKEGYAFIGWQEQSTGLVYAENAAYQVTGSATFTARWEKNDDTVIVKFFDGDGHMVDWMKVSSGDTIDAPGALTKAGFQFTGWQLEGSTGSTPSVAAGGLAKIVGNAGDEVIYVAQWKGENYKLHIQGKNATGNLTVDTKDYPIPGSDVANIDAGTTVTLTAAADEGYVISEVYYTTNEGDVTTKVLLTEDGGKYTFKMPAAEAWLHIVAVQKTYTISVQTDDNTRIAVPGTADVGTTVAVKVTANQDYTVGSVYAKTEKGELIPLVYDAAADNYQFTMPAANVTVYAASVKNAYSLSILDYNNNLIDTVTVDSGDTVDLSVYENALKRTGYTFQQWEVIKGEGKIFTSTSQVRQDTVIRAVYTADAHTVERAADCDDHLETITVNDVTGGSSVDFKATPNKLLNSATDNKVQITVKPEYDYLVSGVAVRGVNGSTTLAQTSLKAYDKTTGEYTYEFTMPAEDVEVAVYTQAKTFNVKVTEDPAEGGDYTINGNTTTNLPVAQGEEVVVAVKPADGWYVERYSVSYTNQQGQTVYVNDANGDSLKDVVPGTGNVDIAFTMESSDVTVAVKYAKTDYTVTPETAQNGTIKVKHDTDLTFADGAITANVGDYVDIQLTPDAGYHAVLDTLKVTDEKGNPVDFRYTGHNGDTYTYRFKMPASSVTVSCEFSQKTYNVIAEPEYTGGKVYVGNTNTNVASFLADSTATVTVKPDAGYRIKIEKGTATWGNNNTDEVTAPYFRLTNEDGTVEYYNSVKVAAEERRKAELGPDYSVVYTPDVNVQYTADGVYTFNMPPYDVYVDTEFEALEYTVDVETSNAKTAGTGVTSVGKTQTVLTDTNLNGAHVGDGVYVKFKGERGYGLSNFEITYEENGETQPITPTQIKKTVNTNQEVVSEYIVYFKMPAANVTVTAEYSQEHYLVSFLDYDNKVVYTETVKFGEHPDAAKAESRLVERPGYNFLGWKSDDTEPPVAGPSKDSADFTIVQVTDIKAMYTENQYDIAYTSGPNGQFAAGKTEQAFYKDTCSFTAVPDTGYMVNQVKATYTAVDGTQQNIDLTAEAQAAVDHAGTTPVKYTFQMPAVQVGTQVKVNATFKPMTFKATGTVVAGQGQITLNGFEAKTVDADTDSTVTVNITPAVGYELTYLEYVYTDPVTGDPVNVKLADTNVDSADFTMPASNVTVKATFAETVYTITDKTAAGAHGTVTIAQPKVAYKSEATVNVVPEAGYQIASFKATYVDENGKEQTITLKTTPNKVQGGDYTFTMPAADVEVTATFEPITYQITTDYNKAQGDIRLDDVVTDSTKVAYTEEVKVTVTPKTGYELTSLEVLNKATGDQVVDLFAQISDVKAGGSATFTMPNYDVVVKATFKAITYHITDKTTDTNGTVTIANPDVAYQSTATVKVVPKAGYQIASFKATYVDENGKEQTITLKGIPNKVQGGNYTFTMPAADVEVIATFEPITYQITTDYNKNQGNIRLDDVVTDSAKVAYTKEVKVTVTPKTGYELTSLEVLNKATGKQVENLFAQISDAKAGGSATFTMPNYDVVVKATFKAITYHVVNKTTDANGKVTVRTPNADYRSTASVEVIPAEGYQIKDVVATYTDAAGKKQTITYTGKPSDLVKGGTYTFTMPAADVNVVATFTEIQYLVNVDLTGNGEIRLDKQDTTSYGYDYKDTVSLTVTPDEGWEIKSVTSAQAKITDNGNGSYTFTMPASNVTVKVVLEKTGYDVKTAVTGEAKGGTVTPSKKVAAIGDNVSAAVAASYGYDLKSVVVTGDSGKVYNVDKAEDGKYYFTMPAENVTVTAEFAKHVFTVVFRDYDGTALDTQWIDYLGAATEPAHPEYEGYTFTGWDQDFTSITSDMSITAQYTINNHTAYTHAISFTGAENGVVTIATGAEANYGDNVVFYADPDDGYRVENVTVTGKSGRAIAVSRISMDAAYCGTYTFQMPDEDVDIVVNFAVQGSSYFTDVRTDSWYYEAVTFVADRGYFNGTGGGLFTPNMNMNRGMFVTVLGRMAGVDVDYYSGESIFSDVASNKYYAPYVAWGVEAGIVKGFEDGTFQPNKDITREQMAAMMRRYCEYCGISLDMSNDNWMERYTDYDQIGSWALEDMTWAVSVGLMRGKTDTTINPKDMATRAQVAQVIKNFCDKVLYQ